MADSNSTCRRGGGETEREREREMCSSQKTSSVTRMDHFKVVARNYNFNSLPCALYYRHYTSQIHHYSDWDNVTTKYMPPSYFQIK
jgi:hypothetical protein